MIRRPPRSTLFPTRRSSDLHPASCLARFGRTWVLCTASVEERVPPFLQGTGRGWVTGEYAMMPRSEEHMSELQSQSNLVCRLLLEKKKKKKNKMKKKQKKRT